ncbi:MAG: hypothetical protein ABIN48_13395 [Ginsengibacter sp.]
MNHSLKTGFIGGCLGAIVLVIIFYLQFAAGKAQPSFVSNYQTTFGAHAGDQIIALILFIISGGIWGIIFGWIVKRPTILKGIFFGILPSLWLWTAVNGAMGKPLFNGFALMGIINPIICNMLIWGSILGCYTSRKLKRISA